MKRALTVMLATLLLAASIPVTAAAAVSWPSISSGKPMTVYTISTGDNTTAYTSSSMTVKKGTIYASDDLRVSSIGKNSKGTWYCYGTYPTKNGRKDAYWPLSVITTAYAPSEVNTSRSGNIQVYRRSSGNLTLGTIAKGDKVYLMASSGNRRQVIYNLGTSSSPTGWKMGWIAASSYDSYIKSKSSDNNNSTPSGSGKADPVSNGWYMIVSGNSEERVLDINNWNQLNGGNLETYARNNTTNQRFYMRYLGNGYYSIRAQHSGRYLHRSDGNPTGANVHQWEGYGNNNAQWKLYSAGGGYYYLGCRSGGYLDNSSGSTKLGNNVITYSFNGSAAQKWRFVSTSGSTAYEKKTVSNGWYMVESGNSSDRVLDINRSNQNNGGNLEIYKKNGTANQVFYLQYMNNGYYSLKARHSNKYIHAKGTNSQTDNVHQWTGTGSNNALWSLEPAGGNYYYLRCKSGNYLDNSGGRTNLSNNVITYNFNGSAAQKWKFISPAAPVKTETYYVTTRAGLILRERPTTSSTPLVTMPWRSSLQVESINGGWAKAVYNGKSGYCSASYISKTMPKDQESSGTWRMPMDNWYCTWKTKTNYSWGGYNPSSSRKDRPYHCGVDIGGTGGRVYAAATGKVVYKNYGGGNGNHVILEHNLNGKTVYSFYAHLSSYGSYKVGDTIKKGTLIGIYGNSGLGSSGGVHLHFGVFTGYSSNPVGYVPKINGNKAEYGNVTFYNPVYVVNNNRLP